MIAHPQDKVGAIRNPEGIWINTEVFSEEAKHFRRYGRYTDAQPGTMAYKEYWDEQLRRRTEGYTVGGAKITGPHYDYLNFCPIKRINEAEAKGVSVAKKRDFPDFWDHDYNYFHSVHIARFGITPEELIKLQLGVIPKKLDGGHHCIIGKTRRRGYSYKGACLANNAYDTVRSSLIMLTAFEKKYLSPKGVLAMFNSQMSHIDAHTAFAKRREYNNTAYHKRASYKKIINGTPTEAGFLSEMMGLSFKDDPDSSRGGDAYLVLMDEAGEWPGLEQAYKVLQPLCEDGMYVTGQIIIFGCVCAGTKVWTHKGEEVNIEDLTQKQGIIGYAGAGVSKEPIVWMKPPAKKPCYRITTSGGHILECSNDHPVLWSKNRLTDGKGNKLVTFMRAEDVAPGDQLMRTRQIPIFGNNKMLNPRLIGMLIGDGYYGKGSTPSISIEGEATYEWLKKNYGGGLTVHKEFTTKKGEPFREVSLLGMQLQLRELEMYGQTWENKSLPDNIHEADQWSISELIGGYFDADGHISYNEKKNVVRAALTSKYRHLLEQVQTLLMKLNVTSNIVKEYRKGGYKPGVIYRLYISKRKDIIEFRKHITLTDPKKQRVLELIDEDKATRSTYDNCAFVRNDDNGKGLYYVENETPMNNLEACFVKSVEFIGEQEVYNLNAGTTHTYITNGFVSGNTGGDMSGGSVDFAKMFYDPDPYNLLPFENIWDDEGEGDQCGFYVPDYKNKVGFIDKQGNSDIEGARKYEEERRAVMLAAGKKEAYNQHIQEFSFMPSESFLITGDNRFPIKNLRRAKQRLEKSGMYKGVPFTFKVDGDEVGYSPDLTNTLTPLYKYAGIIKDNKGAPVMFAPPKLGNKYKIGYDTIHQEQGQSLAGMQVYLDSPLSPNHNRIEACFYGRSTGPDGCDEIAFNFSRLYNDAEIMHENMFLTTKNNFKRWKAEDLLASQPDLLIKNIIKDSKVDRLFGVHMTDKIKLEACLIGARILETVVGFEEDGTPIMYLDTIRDIRLLEELIRFNFTGNFDAVMAFLMRCIHDEEQTLQKIASNPNTKGIGTELEELRNFRNVKGF